MIRVPPPEQYTAAPKLTMQMRALLWKLQETGGNLRSTYGTGFVIRSHNRFEDRAVLVFWTPKRVRDAAIRFGYVDERGRLTSAGRAALKEGTS
jgi:hypothetical protein